MNERKCFLGGRKVLVVLQNAYDKGKLAKRFSPESWMREFETSRTGTRLRVVFDRDTRPTTNIRKCHYVNTTDDIGMGAASKLPPKPEIVRNALKKVSPDVVVACGEQAARVVLAMWPHDLILLPHPAFRLLTNDLLRSAGDALRERLLGWDDGAPLRLSFHQERGRVAVGHDVPVPDFCESTFMVEV